MGRYMRFITLTESLSAEKMETYGGRLHVRRFRISIASRGPAASWCQWNDISKHGVSTTVQGRYRSSRQEVVPTTAGGAATRCMERRIDAGNPHPWSMKWNGFLTGTHPTCCGSPTMFSPFITDGLPNSRQRCGAGSSGFPLNAFRAPIV